MELIQKLITLMTGSCHCKHQAQRLVLNSTQGPSVISFQGKFMTVSQQRSKLHEAKAKLTSYNGGSKEVQGKCIVRITRPDKPEKSYLLQCFVVPIESPPILGLETGKRLNLIRRVMSVTQTTPDFMLKYDDVFGKIELLSGDTILT